MAVFAKIVAFRTKNNSVLNMASWHLFVPF
jgi:hypothetical protein